MTSDLALNNRLVDLAGRIQIAEAAMAESSLVMAERALEAGALLIEAKAACAHGEWLPFLDMAGIAERQAQRLMTLARSGLKSDTVSLLGIRGSLELVAKRKLPAAGDVLVISIGEPLAELGQILGSERAVAIWEADAARDHWNAVFWLAGENGGGGELIATNRPLQNSSTFSIFDVVDHVLGMSCDRMRWQTLVGISDAAGFLREFATDLVSDNN